VEYTSEDGATSALAKACNERMDKDLQAQRTLLLKVGTQVRLLFMQFPDSIVSTPESIALALNLLLCP
jgi:hypothetical protein